MFEISGSLIPPSARAYVASLLTRVRRRPLRWTLCLGLVLLAPIVVGWYRSGAPSVLAQRASLEQIARRYPKFSQERRLAVLRERQYLAHTPWRDLTLAEIANRVVNFVKMAASAASDIPPFASFVGNSTIVQVPGMDFLLLARQPDCSLTLRDLPYTFPTQEMISYTVASSVPNYQQQLHAAAGLTTAQGNFPAGCGDPVLGVTSRKIVFAGTTTSSIKVYAGTFYNSSMGVQQIFTLTSNAADDTFIASSSIATLNSSSIATADLNSDGNGDLVSTNSGSPGVNATISVFLGKPDGSFNSPVTYSLPDTQSSSAVIDDVNGDGIPDIVASSSDTGVHHLNVLLGKGDGTFNAVQSTAVTAPITATTPFNNLITADLLGNGKKDLVTGAGVVLLGNGEGTFSVSPTTAFPYTSGSNAGGPNVVAGDFNKDGKIDLAVNNGAGISIFFGNGDATFHAGPTYASISNVGSLTVTDLDGDGNLDLYSGFANGGMFGGDNFQNGQGYALMGNGDGTFRGAPNEPFVNTGQNVLDLNNDGVLDGVGVTGSTQTTQVAFTTYIGTGAGNFNATSSLVVSPITIGTTTYSFNSIDSYAFGDMNGDGVPDLVYISNNFDGFWIALGNGDGSFGTPAFTSRPVLAPNANTYDGEINGLHLADFNHDGHIDIEYNYLVNPGSSSNNYAEGLAIQLGNGDGTFKAPQVIQTYLGTATPDGSSTITLDQIGDLNGDGAADIVAISGVLDDPSSSIAIYLSNGDGTFAAPTTVTTSSQPEAPGFDSAYGLLSLADMNGDGKVDLVSVEFNQIDIFLGNGDGTFQAAKTTACNDCGVTEGLAVADFNGDGKPDVFTSGINPPFDTGIYLGNGDGILQGIVTTNQGTTPALGVGLYLGGTATAADFNGDGIADILSGTVVLINQNGATSTPLVATTTSLSTSASTAVTGTSITLTATVAPASGSGTPTGTVSFSDGGTVLGAPSLTSGSITLSTSTLAVGTHTITATYSGDSTYASSVSSSVTVTITASTPALIATTTSLTASATSITPGSSVTFTSAVAPSTGTGVPTGTVTFLDGTSTLGTGTLQSGSATFTTTTIAVGTHSITASYGGDTAYAASVSPVTTITVVSNTLPPSFELSLGTTTLTAPQKGSASTTVQITPSNGFSQAVTFSCSGLPTRTACSFSPASVTPSGSAVSSTLTITTGGATAALRAQLRNALPASLACGLFGIAIFRLRRRRLLPNTLASLMLLAFCVGTLIGCGSSSSSTPKGSSTVTVSATSGSDTQTATLTLQVQ